MEQPVHEVLSQSTDLAAPGVTRPPSPIVLALYPRAICR